MNATRTNNQRGNEMRTARRNYLKASANFFNALRLSKSFSGSVTEQMLEEARAELRLAYNEFLLA